MLRVQQFTFSRFGRVLFWFAMEHEIGRHLKLRSVRHLFTVRVEGRPEPHGAGGVSQKIISELLWRMICWNQGQPDAARTSGGV
jgi:hypothetical protein